MFFTFLVHSMLNIIKLQALAIYYNIMKLNATKVGIGKGILNKFFLREED